MADTFGSSDLCCVPWCVYVCVICQAPLIPLLCWLNIISKLKKLNRSAMKSVLPTGKSNGPSFHPCNTHITHNQTCSQNTPHSWSFIISFIIDCFPLSLKTLNLYTLHLPFQSLSGKWGCREIGWWWGGGECWSDDEQLCTQIKLQFYSYSTHMHYMYCSSFRPHAGSAGCAMLFTVHYVHRSDSLQAAALMACQSQMCTGPGVAGFLQSGPALNWTDNNQK